MWDARRWLRPASRADSIYDIDLPALCARGIRGVILDLDNTIVPWGARQAPPELLAWVTSARAHGLRLCIVSNNRGPRVDHLAGALGLPAVTSALKPRRAALRRALAVMGTLPARTALVGDQVFTDILGGNRLGLYTILVRPQSRREFFLTRVVRLLERGVRGDRR
jgi:uncharacterized protein